MATPPRLVDATLVGAVLWELPRQNLNMVAVPQAQSHVDVIAWDYVPLHRVPDSEGLVSVADQMTAGIILPRTESMLVTDRMELAFARAQAETVFVGDSVVSSFAVFRVLSDAATPVDSPSLVPHVVGVDWATAQGVVAMQVRPAASSVVVVGDASAVVALKGAVDTAAATEAMQYAAAVPHVDAAAVADTPALATQLKKSSVASVGDAVSTVFSPIRTPSEFAVTLDGARWVAQLPLAETLAAGESLVLTPHTYKADAVTVGEVFATGLHTTLGDATGTADHAVWTAVCGPVDTVYVGDSVLVVYTIVRTLIEAVSAASQLAVSGQYVLADAAAVVDNLAPAANTVRSQSDGASVGDAVGWAVQIAVPETISVADSGHRQMRPRVAEVLVAAEALHTEVQARYYDSLSAADSAVRTTAFARKVSDGASASEVLAGTISYARKLSDGVSASEVLTRTGAFTRSASDGAAASEVLARAAAYARSASDGASVGDAVVAAILSGPQAGYIGGHNMNTIQFNGEIL